MFDPESFLSKICFIVLKLCKTVIIQIAEIENLFKKLENGEHNQRLKTCALLVKFVTGNFK